MINFDWKQKNILPILGILILTVMLGGIYFISKNASVTKPSQFDPIDYSIQELQKLMQGNDNIIVLDVRSKSEYDKGHIPGAIHVDYYDEEGLAKVVGNKTPITYCTSSIWRAPYAARLLFKKGYTNVGVLTGGIMSWKQEGLPVVTTSGELGEIAEYPKEPFPQREVKVAEVKETVSINVVARTFEFSPNRIEVQEGQRVILNVMSSDITHGFALPEFGINELIQPDQVTRIEFIADRKGTFPFVCSVYCGSGHTSMVGEIVVK